MSRTYTRCRVNPLSLRSRIVYVCVKEHLYIYTFRNNSECCVRPLSFVPSAQGFKIVGCVRLGGVRLGRVRKRPSKRRMLPPHRGMIAGQGYFLEARSNQVTSHFVLFCIEAESFVGSKRVRLVVGKTKKKRRKIMNSNNKQIKRHRRRKTFYQRQWREDEKKKILENFYTRFCIMRQPGVIKINKEDNKKKHTRKKGGNAITIYMRISVVRI